MIIVTQQVSEPLKMVVAFGNQRRVRCLTCQKFIPNAKLTSCPRCFINYQQVDDHHYIALGDS